MRARVSILLVVMLAALALGACGCMFRSPESSGAVVRASAEDGGRAGWVALAANRAAEAKTFDSAAAYLHFLKEFGEAPQAAEIRARLDARAWRRTLASDTTAAYVIYLHDYPHGAHVGEAHAAITSLAYEEAARESTPEAYAAFLRAYPDALDALEARQWLARHAPEALAALDRGEPVRVAAEERR